MEHIVDVLKPHDDDIGVMVPKVTEGLMQSLTGQFFPYFIGKLNSSEIEKFPSMFTYPSIQLLFCNWFCLVFLFLLQSSKIWHQMRRWNDKLGSWASWWGI